MAALAPILGPISPQPAPPHVGTLGEKPLHAELKRRLAGPGYEPEVRVGNYVVDLRGPDEIVEIQTRGFSALRRKLPVLLADHRVRLVHPVAQERVIVRLDDDGVILGSRRSPKRGGIHDVFAELVAIPALLAHPGLTVEVLLVREEEYRRQEPGRAWRRHGWVVQERHLVEIVDRRLLVGPGDLVALLPEGLAVEFTTAELAAALHRPRRLAQQMAYCLREAGCVEAVGKRGNAVVYRRAAPVAGPGLADHGPA